MAADDQLCLLLNNVVERALACEQRQRRRRASDQRVFLDAASALVLNLLHEELEGRGRRVMVPMSKAELGASSRAAPYMTQRFPETVKLLSDAGIVDLRLGLRSPFGGRRSTIGPGKWLLEQLDWLDFDFGCFRRDPRLLGPPVLLKSEKVHGARRVLPLPGTDEAQALVRDMREINARLAAAELDWTGEPVDLMRRYLVRIFSDNSLQLGGRLWRGFWMEQKRADRNEYLRIAGERIESLDFAHMGVTLAYAEVGAKPPSGDLYDIPYAFGYREGVKKVLNALLCSTKVPTRFPAGTRGYFPRGWKFAPLFEDICRRHPRLVSMFGTARALRLQYLESQVMVKALLELGKRDVVGLPIHDALLVGRSNASIAKEILERCFRDVTGLDGKVQ